MCIALVALASMLVFGFAVSMRNLKSAGSTAIAGDLARSAARMGVRHAMETATAAIVQNRLGTSEWPLLCSFGHLDRDDPANPAPDGSGVDPASGQPNPFDGGDNVPADDRMYAMMHRCTDDAKGYAPATWWPWPVTDAAGASTWELRKGAILNPCVPRWIEPGAYSSDMSAHPVRFTAATAPVRGSRPVEPLWYDSHWGAVTDPARARYRLRYAVATFDLGGSFVWGRQLGFIDNEPLSADFTTVTPAATAAATTRFHLSAEDDARDAASGTVSGALRKTPHEWDETTARGYLTSLQSILGKQGVAEGYLAGAPDWRNQGSGYDARPLASALFLGRGSSKVRGDFENEYESPWTSNLLGGVFSTGGGTRPITYPPGRIGPPSPVPPFGLFSFQSFARPNQNSFAAICQGGPPSWQAADNVGRSGFAGDYWLLWSCSPFGRVNEFDPAAFTPAALAAGKPAYYKGRTDNPWRINLMTAPPDTIRMMLYGYLPQVALKEPLVSIGGSLTATYSSDGSFGGTGVLRSGLNTDPSPDVTSTAFDPRSMRTTYRQALQDSGREVAGEARLFSTFTFPDRSASPSAPSYTDRTITPTTYDAAYPGPKEEWEDYARLELHPECNSVYMKAGSVAGDPPRLGSDGSFDYGHLYKCMLGARCTAFNDPDWPRPATGWNPAGNAGMGSLSVIASSGNAWQPNAAHPETRASILFSGLWLPADNGGPTWYNAKPFEPMLGSGALLCQKLLGKDPNGNHEVRYDSSHYIQNTASTASGIPFNIRNQRPFFFRDSYWLDLMHATAAAISTTKALYQDPAHVGLAARFAVRPGTANFPAGWRPSTIREVDALFLAYLGEWHPATPLAAGMALARPGDPSTPPTFIVAKSLSSADIYANEAIRVPRVVIDYQAKWNIASLHLGDAGGSGFLSAPEPAIVGGALEDTTDSHGVGLDKEVAYRKTINMERVLNDWRMSFFGANPEYADFTPLDFNGDGFAVSSAYGACDLRCDPKDVMVPDPTSAPPATRTVPLPGRAYPSRAAADGVGPAPDLWFSLTGFLVFDKVRYIRTIVRGQVWDEVRRVPVSSAELDAVLAVDPDGEAGVAGGNGLTDSSVLYQRWMHNNYTGNMARSPE